MKRICSPTLLVALSAGSVLATSATHADLLVYDGFDIEAPGDALNGKATGMGLSGNWTGYDRPNDMVIGDGSLSYGSLATSGNHMKLSDATNGRAGVSAALGTTLSDAGVMADGETVWMSFLFNIPTISGNNRAYVNLATDGSQTGGQSISNSGSAIGIEVDVTTLEGLAFENGVRTNSGSSNLGAEGTSMIVMEIIWGADSVSDDTVNVYLPDTDLNLGSVVVSHTAVVDQSAFDLLVVAGKWDMPVVDELRIGESFADVAPAAAPIPEPASLALLGMGGLLVARRRRN